MEIQAKRYENAAVMRANARIAELLKTVDEKISARVDQFFEERVAAEAKRRLEAAAAMPAQSLETLAGGSG